MSTRTARRRRRVIALALGLVTLAAPAGASPGDLRGENARDVGTVAQPAQPVPGTDFRGEFARSAAQPAQRVQGIDLRGEFASPPPPPPPKNLQARVPRRAVDADRAGRRPRAGGCAELAPVRRQRAGAAARLRRDHDRRVFAAARRHPALKDRHSRSAQGARPSAGPFVVAACVTLELRTPRRGVGIARGHAGYRVSERDM